MRVVKTNDIYRHFKGSIYKVIAIASDADSLKKLVIYENIKTHDIWARDYQEFISLVDKEKYPNVQDKYRFTLIKN